jgi:hypothetical protein
MVAGAPKMENENLAFPETVGQLHEAIENLGPGAWRMFTRRGDSLRNSGSTREPATRPQVPTWRCLRSFSS